MIPRLPGWRVVDEGDGTVDLARGSSRLRYAERNRPLRTIREAALHALCDGWTVGTEQGLVTREGEHAAIVCAHAAGSQRAFAGVVADDFYTLAELTTPDPARFATDRAELAEMIARDALCLGVRRRRVRHVAPQGWQHVRRGIADSYERRGARLRVYPASPLRTDALAAADALCAELAAAGFIGGVTDSAPLQLADGPAGVCVELVGAFGATSTHHAFAVLEDARYLYLARLDAPAGELDRAALLGVVRTLEPVPGPPRVEPPGVFAHWV